MPEDLGMIRTPMARLARSSSCGRFLIKRNTQSLKVFVQEVLGDFSLFLWIRVCQFQCHDPSSGQSRNIHILWWLKGYKIPSVSCLGSLEWTWDMYGPALDLFFHFILPSNLIRACSLARPPFLLCENYKPTKESVNNILEPGKDFFHPAPSSWRFAWFRP